MTSWPRFYSRPTQKYTASTFWVLFWVFPVPDDMWDVGSFHLIHSPRTYDELDLWCGGVSVSGPASSQNPACFEQRSEIWTGSVIYGESASPRIESRFNPTWNNLWFILAWLIDECSSSIRRISRWMLVIYANPGSGAFTSTFLSSDSKMMDRSSSQYDSFLFWRQPIPELDLSELEDLGLMEEPARSAAGKEDSCQEEVSRGRDIFSPSWCRQN